MHRQFKHAPGIVVYCNPAWGVGGRRMEKKEERNRREMEWRRKRRLERGKERMLKERTGQEHVARGKQAQEQVYICRPKLQALR